MSDYHVPALVSDPSTLDLSNVTVVWSPIGGCGRSTFADVLAASVRGPHQRLVNIPVDDARDLLDRPSTLPTIVEPELPGADLDDLADFLADVADRGARVLGVIDLSSTAVNAAAEIGAAIDRRSHGALVLNRVDPRSRANVDRVGVQFQQHFQVLPAVAQTRRPSRALILQSLDAWMPAA